MDFTAWLAIAIFIGSYALIVSERVHRTIAAMFGGMLMIITGILSQDQALRAIDFNTLGLLVGMMIIVYVLGQTGFFNYLAIKAAHLAKGNPLWLLILLAVLTAVCSAFLDNVTTVLLTVPVMFKMTSQLQVNPRPFLISQIMASNIGGTATLIGDPPNIMIGSKVPGMDFMAFITNLSGICTLIFIVTILIIVLIYRKELHTTQALKERVLQLNARKAIKRHALLRRCLFVLAMTLTLFTLHGSLHLQSGTVALWGATFLMLLTLADKPRILNRAFGHLEWTAIFFFIGLFMLVGGLEHCGIINMLATEAIAVTQGDTTSSTMMILSMSALLSAFVDNIPFVATMIPLIKDMGTMGMANLEPLWWALSLGACLGGNGTIIGASANVVALSMASQRGLKVSFIEYLKIAFPLMLLSIVMAGIYLYFRYL